jgi:hypothetical protein
MSIKRRLNRRIVEILVSTPPNAPWTSCIGQATPEESLMKIAWQIRLGFEDRPQLAERLSPLESPPLFLLPLLRFPALMQIQIEFFYIAGKQVLLGQQALCLCNGASGLHFFSMSGKKVDLLLFSSQYPSSP